MYSPPPVRRAFSSSVFILFDQKVLLIRHKLLDLWLPVGGELETRTAVAHRGQHALLIPELETPLECARREALEETGLLVKFPRFRTAPAGTPPGFLGFEEHEAGPKGYHMNFCFLAYASSNHVVSDGSWDKHRWVHPHDAQGDKNLKAPENVLDMLWQVALTPRPPMEDCV